MNLSKKKTKEELEMMDPKIESKLNLKIIMNFGKKIEKLEKNFQDQNKIISDLN